MQSTRLPQVQQKAAGFQIQMVLSPPIYSAMFGLRFEFLGKEGASKKSDEDGFMEKWFPQQLLDPICHS